MAKLNYYDFVSTDENRYFLTGIYHKEGLKVMTDARVLLVVKESYDPSLEGVILSKDMEKLTDYSFPNWKKVVPDMSNYVEIPFTLTEKKYKDIKVLVDLQRKINGTKHKNIMLTDSYYKMAENCFINFEYLKQVFEVVNNYQVKMYIDSTEPNKRAIVFKTDDDACLFLIMPMCNAEIEGLNELEGVYFPKLKDDCFKVEDPSSDMMEDGRLVSALYRINKQAIYNKLKNNLPLNKTEEKTLCNVKTLLENFAK